MKNYIPVFSALCLGVMVLGFAAIADASDHPDSQEEDQAWSGANMIKTDTCNKELKAIGDAVKYQNCFSDIISTYVIPHAVNKNLMIGLSFKMLQPAKDFDDGKTDIEGFQLEESEILSDYYMQRSEIISANRD